MESADTRKDSGRSPCRCPYCETECVDIPMVCSGCQIMIIECSNCGKPVREDADTCPHCGKTP
ncbi:MAG: zinc-ribbon domain-containing protein [Actinobacteria bacterium]|nr:zinc-ribbon domain-containing protein [Actinomycetota bacterium]